MSGAAALDEAHLDRVWLQVTALKENILEAESNANLPAVANPWKRMRPEEKRSVALMAVESLLLGQFQDFIEVKIEIELGRSWVRIPSPTVTCQSVLCFLRGAL